MEDLESGNLSYAIVGEYLADLKEGFGGRDNETMKVAKLIKVEQGGKTIKKFVQKFREMAKDSEYKRRLLVEEFKRGINGVIRQKLIKSEYPLWYIKQWYKQVVNLNRYWRESQREKKRLKGRQKIEAQASRLNALANTSEAQRQQMSQPQVWLQRQEVQQQMLTEPILMEAIERTNVVVVYLN